MRLHIVVLAAVLHFSHTFPAKLLRMPKIYNALISTNQKLLPSEAFAGTTGPVFQPIGLSGDPILLNPEVLGEEQPSSDDRPRPFSKQPLTFYPRYNIYHQYPQSIYPYGEIVQPPPVVVPALRSQPPIPPKGDQKEEEHTTSDMTQPSFGFFMNNRPANSAIPNVPPPPPPMGAAPPASNSAPPSSQES